MIRAVCAWRNAAGMLPRYELCAGDGQSAESAMSCDFPFVVDTSRPGRHFGAAVPDYIDRFYNRCRRHSTLGLMAPAMYELHHAA